MRRSMTLARPMKIAALCGALGLGWMAGGGSGDLVLGEEPAATDLALRCDEPPAHGFTPPSHAELYQKLTGRRTKLDFQLATPVEMMAKLSEDLGAPIEIGGLDGTGAGTDALERRFTVVSETELTLGAALRLAISRTTLGQFQIALTDKGVRLVGPVEAADRRVLVTHDLRAASNYTTAMRRTFIEYVRGNVSPEEWKQPDGAWLGPAASVFAIDVYARTKTHEAIEQYWRQHFVAGLEPTYVDFVRVTGKETPEQIEKLGQELRKKFPLESLAKRLEYEAGNAAGQPPALSHDVEQRLDQRDQQDAAAVNDRYGWHNLRSKSLTQLHRNEVNAFISREGFGRSRMILPSPSFLPLRPTPQLPLASADIEPAAEAMQPTRIAKQIPTVALPFNAPPSFKMLSGFHIMTERQFLAPERLGYIKDREHVAGFASHAVATLPKVEDMLPAIAEPEAHWAIRRMELVSLLKHAEPRVYMSETAPRMEDLAEARTRPLSSFETEALQQLRADEDIVARATTNRLEMVGALRASKQCLQCHQAQRGQLLGAFTYSLVRDPILNRAPQAESPR